MRNPLLVIALAAVAALPSLASAQTAPSPPPPRPMHADRDHATTLAETIARAQARFARLDTDRDGKISAAERQAGRVAMRDRWRAERPGRRADADGNGLIAKAEWQARAAAQFDRLDANHDGSLDKGERAAMNEMRHHRRDGQRGMMPSPPAKS